MVVLWPNGSSAPTPPRVSSEFGMRTHPVTGVPQTFHYGIDLVGWSIIKAPANGVISFAGYNGGAGNEVRLKADNGDVFRMLHNRELWVRTGQRVAQGQDVAVMGTTGSSTGVHCHFETKPGGGNAENPRNYMARANAGQPAGGGGKPVEEPPTAKEEDVIIYRCTANGARGIALKGGTWIQGAEGPLRQLTDEEKSAYEFWNQRGIPVRWADWSGDAIEKQILVYGVREFRGIGRFEDGLSGRIRYDKSRVEFPGAHADNPATLTDAQAAAIAETVAKAIKPGASASEVQAIVTDALKALTLRTA